MGYLKITFLIWLCLTSCASSSLELVTDPIYPGADNLDLYLQDISQKKSWDCR